MAVKDHSLDDRIVQASRAEFLEKGFRKASLRDIAGRAGLSTGALYTRYDSKDVLFCSLVKGVMDRISSGFSGIRDIYAEAQRDPTPDSIMNAIREEERIYLKLLFEYYDDCIMLFCRSDGSSIQLMMDDMMEKKAQGTVRWLSSISAGDIDIDGIEFILSEQFHYYRKILMKGYTREKAISCMRTVENFLESGWKDLLCRILG